MPKISNSDNLFLEILKSKSWILIFIFSFIYWSYLVFHTKMIVIFDSIQYENTGMLIYQSGWLSFFQKGPHRELLYPALISISMAWANFLSIDYQLVLKVLQVALLFLTQILLLVLLRKLNLRQGVIKAAVFYFGISPATINAAFSVYYEIVVFPFVVAVVLLVTSLWSDILQEREYRPILEKSILFGVCFSLLALGRDIFQVVFYFFIAFFCVFLIFSLFKHQQKTCRGALIFILTVFAIFYSTTSFIKTMNLRYNGKFVLSDSHLSNFLACVYKRSVPITPRILAAHIALIPGTGVCRMFFSQQECDYADWYGMKYFQTKVGERMAEIPKDRHWREIIWPAMGKIIIHPFQYTFFSAVEALKMPFWESTQIGFVNYPKFLTIFYNNLLVRLGLRLFIGLITIISFIFVTCNIWEKKLKCFREAHNQGSIMLFFVWLMITLYTALYSTCYVVTRYALPIVSMFIVCISFTINAIIAGKSGNIFIRKN